jgi:hypothetical protein
MHGVLKIAPSGVIASEAKQSTATLHSFGAPRLAMTN